MRVKVLTATLAYLQRAMADPRLETAQWEKLRKGAKELERVRRSGKLDRSRVFRATMLISETLVETLSLPQGPTQTEAPIAARRAK